MKALRISVVLVVACATLLPTAGLASETSSSIHPEYGVLLSPMQRLEPGDSGNSVMTLQSALRDRGFYRGAITGEYDTATETAVITLHKYLGTERTSTFNSLDWIRIAFLPDPEIPYRWDEPDRVEIDTTRQLLYVIRDHRIEGILPTSTGSGASYFSVRQGRNVRSATPHGDFELYWRQYGWNCDSTTGWCVYSYWGFTPFYGIHGYRNVPAYPASHGCARVNIWDSDWLDGFLYIGMPVHIWRDLPADEIPPPEMLDYA
jgi:hypothetical protein